jgi:subtilisin family serine protease
MKNLFLVFVAVLIGTSCQKQARDILRQPETILEHVMNAPLWETVVPGDADVVPGQVLFRLRDNNSLRRVAGKIPTRYARTKAMERSGHNGYHKVLVKPGREKEISKLLEIDPNVLWAEPNYIVKRLGTPDDTYWNNDALWGMKHVKADSAWASGNFGNTEIHIGITDEGIFPHADLCPNIWRNMEEVNGVAEVDDDGNGYVDDFYGWNFKDNNNLVYMGGDKHGTHVAGTIGAKGGNGIGVIGVMSNVKLISVKFLQGWGTTEDATRGNDYLTDLVTRKNIKLPANNNSWGGGGFSSLYIESVHRAGDAGILNVYASGNADNNNDINPAVSFPGAYTDLDETMIAVVATDWQNNKASFSSYGRTKSHIGAPGTGIVSTVPTDDHQSGYAYFSGTSMAAPHVTGACGLYSGIHDELWVMGKRQRAVAIKTALLNSATKLPQLKDYCQGDNTGGNFLNVASFIGQTPENPPTNAECPPIVIDNNAPYWPEDYANFDIYEVGFDPNPGPFYGGYYGVRWNTAFDPEGGQVGYLLWENDIIFPFALYGTNWVIAGIDDTSKIIIGKANAFDPWGNPSPFSNTDTADWSQTPSPPPTDTEPPSNVALTINNPTVSSLNLEWTSATDNSGSVVYDMYRNGTLLIPNLQGTAYTNTGLASGATYTYYVKPKDPTGNTSQSNTVSGTTLFPTPPPTYTVSATLNGASPQVLPTVALNYSITTNGTVSQMVLERKKGGSSFIEVPYQTTGTPGTITNTFPPNEQQPGQYTYRLKVTISQGVTAYSPDKIIQVKKK